MKTTMTAPKARARTHARPAQPAPVQEAAPANGERLSLIRTMVRRKKIHGHGTARGAVLS